MTLVHPNLYIGTPDLIDPAVHDVVVNINSAASREDLTSVVEMSFGIKENELVETEIPRVVQRLSDITERMRALQRHVPVIIVVCATGREGAPLVAGYYMRTCGITDAADKLEYIYMSPEERTDDIVYKKKIAAIESGSNDEFTLEETDANAARHAKRCLTLKSYRALLG